MKDYTEHWEVRRSYKFRDPLPSGTEAVVLTGWGDTPDQAQRMVDVRRLDMLDAISTADERTLLGGAFRNPDGTFSDEGM